MFDIKRSTQSITTGFKLLPAVAKQPPLLKFCLADCRSFRKKIVIGLLILVIPFPFLLGWTLDFIYPPITISKQNLFVKSESQKANPKRELRQTQIISLSWLLTSGGLFLFFIGRLPSSINSANKYADTLRLQAKDIIGNQPAQALRLEQQAETLTLLINRPDAVEILDKNTDLDKTLVSNHPRHEKIKTIDTIGPDQRYKLKERLAKGGMGAIYQGEDTVLKRPVAIKELLSDLSVEPEQADRFRQEALALAQLSHPYIVPIYDLIEEHGRFWIVMELLTGGDLSQLIKTSAPMQEKSALDMTQRICEGLQFAHQQNIVHRDIKPMNVLLTTKGLPKLTDFGIAKLAQSNVKTQEGLILGSPGYMSPEQAEGKDVDLRSDIYSIGIMLYQMLTAELPFTGDASQVMIKHLTQQPVAPKELNIDISDKINELILSMLEKSPEQRPQNLQTVIDLL